MGVTVVVMGRGSVLGVIDERSSFPVVVGATLSSITSGRVMAESPRLDNDVVVEPPVEGPSSSPLGGVEGLPPQE